VKATNGDTHLGGDDFDQKIMEWILSEFKRVEGIDLSKDALALQRIKDAAEKAKIELSSAQETEINQPFITSGAEGPKHLLIKLSRAKLEDLVGELVEKTFGPVRQVITDSGFSKDQINEVVMVGGMTRMPLVQKKVEEFFGKKPHFGVNPDEVVAVGAAIQAGQFEGTLHKDILLLDVTPLSLGIETLGGVMTKLIEKNTTIPTSKSQVFSTAADNQPSVEVHVLQGERSMASDNKTLGHFMLDGLPPAPRGVPQVEVTFDIDANGILSVKAKDKATNREQSIRIEASSGLSKDEIERMKKDAEMHAADDQKKREMSEVKNVADTLVYSSEKLIQEAKDKKFELSAEEVGKLQEKIEAVKKLQTGTDSEALKKASDELGKVAQEIGTKLYQSTQAKGGAGAPGAGPAGAGDAAGGPGPKKSGDDVVEGEVVDDKK
jgi:molecular chaperone DnaK